MHDDETGRDADGRPAGGFSESGGPPEGPVAAPEGPPAEPSEGRPDEVSFGPAGAAPRARRRGRVAVYAIVVLAAAGLGTAAAGGLTSHPGTPVTGVASHQVPRPQ